MTLEVVQEYSISDHVESRLKKPIQIANTRFGGATLPEGDYIPISSQRQQSELSITGFNAGIAFTSYIEWEPQSVTILPQLYSTSLLLTEKTKPEFAVDQSSKTVLTGNLRDLANQVLEIIRLAARSLYIPVTRVEVRGFHDTEEGFSELVIIQFTKVKSNIALRYWDKLGVIIEAWSEKLPLTAKNMLDDRISIEVRWSN